MPDAMKHRFMPDFEEAVSEKLEKKRQKKSHTTAMVVHSAGQNDSVSGEPKPEEQ